jgi:putative NADH-flavin reductase
MKIALVGATGNVGTRLISELTRRGHHVTAIARHPEKLQGQASVSPVSGDVQNENALAAVLAGHDVVIHSVKFLSTNASKIIAATKAAKVPRLLVVGGAGSLEVSPGLTLVNTPDFPAEYKPETLAGVEFLNVLRGRRNSIGHSYVHPTFLFPANAPANSDSIKTNFWSLLTAKAAYLPKTLRSHSWMSWNSRSTLANDSRLGADN